MSNTSPLVAGRCRATLCSAALSPIYRSFGGRAAGMLRICGGEGIGSLLRSADAALCKEVTFRSLRHGFCTALAEVGRFTVVIMEADRHADLVTSMHLYMANAKLKAVIEVF